jgi:hypothetical protein
MKFIVKFKKTVTDTHGENGLSRARVFEWHKRFSEWREDVEGDERPGRQVTMNTVKMWRR